MSDNQLSEYQKIIWGAGLDVDEAVEIMGIARKSFYNNHLKEYPSAPFLKKQGKIKGESEVERLTRENAELKARFDDLSKQLKEANRLLKAKQKNNPN